MQNVCEQCGAELHVCYVTTGLCEDCWVNELARLDIKSTTIPLSMRIADPDTPSIRRGRVPNIAPSQSA